MSKKRVHYVCGPIGDPGGEQVWGGTAATNYILKKAFENSDEYELVMRPRYEFFSIVEVDLFLKSGDISWIDDTGVAGKYCQSGFERPDILGPICRSPLKRYNQGQWVAKYTPEWFYSGKVLRLNESEEKKDNWLETYKKSRRHKNKDFVDKTNFIRHAIDLEMLEPSYHHPKKYVLWAGNRKRDAKNFQLFQEIVDEVEKKGGLPEGYEFLVLSDYVIGEYYKTLDDTALLVNTSKYESFCNAVAEAMAKGVPTLVRKDFNGDYMFKNRPIQVDYDANSYVDKILELLNSGELVKYQKEAREYAEKNFSLETMRKDIEKVFDEVLEEKNGKTSRN